ncbi:glycosyltransferase family 4 protein [Corynebacterium uterequi]|uniref:Glycosyltransferase n=1 Tax=Corynebacterium uterequi TaxID=1072256 RepID=A0A0G3HJG0_9CORY|nr:glycosyltransferase family 4 protein [Corynebacterium uterequi]AKK11242.1 glycosyltransferase [Corynebacterium uterequi]
MRIGLICPYSLDHPGGVQAHVLDLARVLREQGHTVGVLGPATRHADVPPYVTRGGRAWAISYNGSVARLAFGPMVLRRMRRFVTEGQFDVVHIHEPNALSYSLATLRGVCGPVVATYHASATQSALLSLSRGLLEPYLERITAGIAVSETARRWQVEQLGGDPVVIPNGVDTAFFASRSKPRRVHPDGPVDVVFLGRADEPRKGLQVLLAAARPLLDAGAVRLRVVGPAPSRREPGVDYTGRVSEEDKARILGAADVYVAPNLGGESFGIVLVEAMAAGCAVLASDLESFADVCAADSDAPAGELFRTGDVADLHAHLTALVEDPQRRADLAEQGQRRAVDFDWAVVSKQILAVYDAVATGTPVTVTRRHP